jgi:hypothetical protein
MAAKPAVVDRMGDAVLAEPKPVTLPKPQADLGA